MARSWEAWAAAALAAIPVGARAGSSPLYTEARPADARTADARPTSGLPALTKLAQSVLPAVVGVLTIQGEAASSGDPTKDLFEKFRGGEGVKKGLATGFVIHPDGYIVTNAHVIEDANRIEVEVGDDERLPARVVGSDEASDVALLKVEAGRSLPVLPLGDSDRLEVAEWILVVGNPFGLSHSVTVGIVSQVGRSDVAPSGRDGFYDFIQTDASINPGNSGGPLLNLRGEVVGIATAINATGQGIGFAVPINMAKDILGQLRDSGRIVRSWMGVSVREGHAQAAPASTRRREVVVTDVVSGGPAATGGLRVGDVITAFEGREIPSAARLRWLVSTAGVGRSVSLTVRRGPDQRAMQIRLTQQPGAETAAAEDAGGRRLPRAIRDQE